MLTKKELESYTSFSDPYQVEKDYLQDVILQGIYSKRYTTNSFIFKGGTALSKFYYSNRFSEDLDFTFTEGEPDIDALSNGIEKIVESLVYTSTITKNPSVNKFNTINAEIVLQGPRYNGKPSTMQHISLGINTSATLKYKPVSMVKRPVYKDVPDYTAFVMDSREILAEKVRAIMSKTRKHKERDLYDMCFLFGKGIEPDKAVVSGKLVESDIDFSKEELLRSIGEVERTWLQLEPFLNQKLLAYKETAAIVVNGLRMAGIL